MIKLLTTDEIADLLYEDNYANWSYNGSHALAKHLEEYEKSIGEMLEFNEEEIRGNYSEYSNAVEAAIDLGIEFD